MRLESPTRGTGSVKQVFAARLATGEEAVLGVRREGVIEDMQSTMGALDVLEDTKHLTSRIKPMLEREVDFRNEPPAFEAMRATPLGQSPLVTIPTVMHATAETIIRTVAAGDVISQILRQPDLTADEKARLYELHKLIVRTALDTQPGWLGRFGKEFGTKKTFVLTDPHGGTSPTTG